MHPVNGVDCVVRFSIMRSMHKTWLAIEQRPRRHPHPTRGLLLRETLGYQLPGTRDRGPTYRLLSFARSLLPPLALTTANMMTDYGTTPYFR